MNVPRLNYGTCLKKEKYKWLPFRCTLTSFDKEHACDVLEGASRSILFVGDSTTSQLFLSLSMLLGAKIGPNKEKKSVLTEISATCCHKKVTLTFVRNDLLLYTDKQHDATYVRKCFSNYLFAKPFTEKAQQSDIVIWSTGHHYPSLEAQIGSRKHSSFFFDNLNHSFTQVAASRLKAGKTPQSLIYFGAPLPSPSCKMHDRPTTFQQYLIDDAKSQTSPRTPFLDYATGWGKMTKYNTIARSLSESLGGSYIDIEEMSAQRPDAAMANSGRVTSKRTQDCLHYCMPGPTDTWANLLINLIASWRKKGYSYSPPSVVVDGINLRRYQSHLSHLCWWPPSNKCAAKHNHTGCQT